MKKYQVPKNSAIWVRVTIELCATLILIYPSFFQHDNMKLHQRGFFCDDQSIKHPIVEEEIPWSLALTIWAIIVFSLISTIELLHVTIFPHLSPTPLGKWVPWIFIELYRIVGYFILGVLFTLLTTEMVKLKVGRLRPYFLTVCKPILSDAMCKDNQGYNIFVEPESYNCTGEEAEREARKSFPSGHTSLSFYTATFLIVYMKARLQRMSSDQCDDGKDKSFRIFSMMFSGLKILRPFLQFGILTLATYIALTRISDYKHHPGDVLAGMVVGIFFALMTLIFLMDLFHCPRSFDIEDKADKRLEGVDNVVEHSNVDGTDEGMDSMRMHVQNKKK